MDLPPHRAPHYTAAQSGAIRARDLPKRRNQLLRHLTDPTSPLRTKTSPAAQPPLDLLERHLHAADLYWVSSDMSALALSAGAQLDAVGFGPEERPSGCGLIFFDGGVGAIPFPRVDVPCDAIVWGPCPEGLLLWALIARSTIAANLRTGVTSDHLVGAPPLSPMAAMSVPVQAEPVAVAELDDMLPAAIVQAVCASWLLMRQPTLVEREQVRPDKSVRRVTQRLGMADPQVSIVDLRRQFVPDGRDEVGEEGGRRYRNRWVVSGHWRDQAWGPGRALRRRTWIPAYVKGPEGAPLVVTERVNVWRR